MGILRILLALAVVVGHIRPTSFLFAGAPAVEVFFLISGFLISYIIRQQKVYKHVSAFYLNRALRIYPIYFVVAAVTLIFRACSEPYFQNFSLLNLEAKTLLLGSNLVLFGQDWVMFLQQSGHQLRLAIDYGRTAPQLWQFLLIPPAWSLGVELTFYAIAPFVVRSRLQFRFWRLRRCLQS